LQGNLKKEDETMKKVRPINGKVVVQPFESEGKTSGGIYIPDTAKESLNEGKVIAVAKDATDEVAVGDRVVYKGFGGSEIEIEGEKYILLTEDELLAKYEVSAKIPE
jgi:chaperonin GroES